MASGAGGFFSGFSGLIGRRRQGYGSIDNTNIPRGDDGDQENEEEFLLGAGGALLPGAEPPDRPGAPSHEEQQQQQEQPPPPPRATPPPIVNPEDVESEEEAVQSLTQRLRCLFTVLTVSINIAINVNLNTGRLGGSAQYAYSYLTFSIFVVFSYPPVAHYSDRHSPIVPPAVRAVRCLRHRPTPTVFGTASRICHHKSATVSVCTEPSNGQIPSLRLLSGEGWSHQTAGCSRL